MKRCSAWFALVWLGLVALGSAQEKDVDGWITMFDGKTLNGWKANEAPECWSVEDGTLNYVTIQGDQNSVSLDLVDRELSQRLNRDRRVAFGLPSH